MNSFVIGREVFTDTWHATKTTYPFFMDTVCDKQVAATEFYAHNPLDDGRPIHWVTCSECRVISSREAGVK